MSDISNVLRKVIELDISLGLDGTQEALDEITRLTSEAAWARGAAEQAERQIEEAHKAIPAHCWRDPPKGRAWTIGEAITSLAAEVERLRSLTVVQESLIRKSEAENEKLRAALEKIVEIRSYRKAEAGELFEIARAALAAAINSWPRIKIHTDGTEDWIELTLTQEKP